MASSAHKHHHHLSIPRGTTSAPPPTPSSTQPITSDSSDAFSLHLRSLPPTLSLSLLTRHSPNNPTTTLTTPRLLSLPSLRTTLLSASQELGFFQLTHHSIPSHLAHAAESDSLSLFQLSHHQKQLCFPKNWPLGFDHEDDDEENKTTESFCFDLLCSSDATELELTHMREFTREMERVGLDVVEAISCVLGLENPGRLCSLMWVSKSSSTGNIQPNSCRFYPYVIGLHYQIRSQKYSILAESGWVCVSPEVDSVLVTLGDIAQVWSNGKLKKVRGRPVPCPGDGNNSETITMSLLVTLPVDSIVYPFLSAVGDDGKEDEINKGDSDNGDSVEEERVFNSFPFEDYAWRVYHDRILLKDPLFRYHI